MKKLFFVLLAIAAMLTGCLDDSRMTVVLPTGTVSTNVIPDAVRERLTEHIPIYEGDDTPDISGYFLEDNVVALYCSDEGNGGFEPGYAFADEYIHFGEVSSNGLIYVYEQKQAGEYSTSELVQVMGIGSNFTAYYVTEGYSDRDNDGTNETWTKVSTILSGTITNEGIRNLKKAIILVDKIDPFDVIMAINEYRVFEEADGLAARIQKWNMPERKGMPADKKFDNNVLPDCISINR